jgi:hypothetical protein
MLLIRLIACSIASCGNGPLTPANPLKDIKHSLLRVYLKRVFRPSVDERNCTTYLYKNYRDKYVEKRSTGRERMKIESAQIVFNGITGGSSTRGGLPHLAVGGNLDLPIYHCQM